MGVVDFVTMGGAKAVPPVRGGAPGMACGGFLAAIQPPVDGGAGGVLVGLTLGGQELRGPWANALSILYLDDLEDGIRGEPFRPGPDVELDAVEVSSSRDRVVRVAVGMVGAGVLGGTALRGRVALYAVEGWRPLWMVEGREPEELFGASVDDHPDLDGDGVDEVVVGVPGITDAESGSTGGVVLLSGATGRILWEYRDEVPDGGTGLVARTVGDLDGDGMADVMTGRAVVNPASNLREIEILVVGGKDGRLLATFRPGIAVSDPVYSMEPMGDLDADGIGDVALGLPDAGSGRVVVLSGADGSTLWDLGGEDIARDGALGESLASLPDIDGDGLADLAVGAPKASRPGSFGWGVVLLVSGSDGRVIRVLSPPE